MGGGIFYFFGCFGLGYFLVFVLVVGWLGAWQYVGFVDDGCCCGCVGCCSVVLLFFDVLVVVVDFGVWDCGGYY